MEARRDGTRAIRFGGRELPFEEVRDSPQEPRTAEFGRPGSSASRRTASAETRPPRGRPNSTDDAEAKPKATKLLDRDWQRKLFG